MTENYAVELHVQQDGTVPDWIHLVPSGTFTGVDGRGPFALSDPAGVIARSLPPDGRPIPVDYNHASHRAVVSGGHAPAAGWISQLQARPDGIWGHVEWTRDGREAVAGKSYRFLSPGFTRGDDQTVRQIVSAGLTNLPNLPALVALNTQEQQTVSVRTQLAALIGLDDDATPEDIEAAALRSLQSAMSFKGQLCAALGRPPTSDQAQILAAVMLLTADMHAIDTAKFVPIELFQQTLEEYRKNDKGVSPEFAEHLVDQAIGQRKLMGFMRDYAMELCTHNREAFDKLVLGPAGQQVEQFHRSLEQNPLITGPWVENAQRRDRSGQHHSAIHAGMGLTPEDTRKYGDR